MPQLAVPTTIFCRQPLRALGVGDVRRDEGGAREVLRRQRRAGRRAGSRSSSGPILAQTRLNLTYGCGDVGELLSTAARIRDGDADSWCGEWPAMAQRVEAIADGCAGRRACRERPQRSPASERLLRPGAVCGGRHGRSGGASLAHLPGAPALLRRLRRPPRSARRGGRDPLTREGACRAICSGRLFARAAPDPDPQQRQRRTSHRPVPPGGRRRARTRLQRARLRRAG
jgi:hypothetical protein